jgi:V/A-type H+-transporting ATPase subunit E
MDAGVDRICRRILDDTASKAEAVKKQAAQEAAKIEAEAREKAAQFQTETLERAQQKAAELEKRRLGNVELEARKELLAAKQALIDVVFQQALETLVSLETGEYFQLLKKMVLDSVETGRETLILSPRDRERVPTSFLEEINRDLKSRTGGPAAIRIAEETREMSGGFMLQGEKVEINGTFESLLETQRDLLEAEVATILFAEETTEAGTHRRG